MTVAGVLAWCIKNWKLLLAGFLAGCLIYTGWSWRDAIADRDAERAQLALERSKTAAAEADAEHLRTAIAMRDRATAADAERAAEQSRTISEFEEKTGALESQIAKRVCFSAADVQRLRDNWHAPRRAAAPAAVPRNPR